MNSYYIKDHDIILDVTDQSYVLRVRDLPHDEKPREKMLERGIEMLSSSELVAVLLNTGTKKEGVLEMARRIIKEYGEDGISHQKDPQKIANHFRIPLTKACQLAACFELGRRLFSQQGSRSVFLRTPRQAFAYLKDMRDLPKEYLRGLYLNSRYHLIHDEVISIGSLTGNIVHPREVFRPALEYGASAIILAHNHPSQSLTPSSADRLVTDQLIEAGRMLGIELLDHIIITKKSYASIIHKK